MGIELAQNDDVQATMLTGMLTTQEQDAQSDYRMYRFVDTVQLLCANVTARLY